MYQNNVATFLYRLRALSDGNTVTSPPPSPGFTKYKLAEHRYGREEMLALFSTKLKVPDKMKQHSCILLEKPATPLALLPTSEEEQVNSANDDQGARMTYYNLALYRHYFSKCTVKNGEKEVRPWNQVLST